jgi:hypothetical protein
MKKLLILTAVLLLAGAAGCKSCDKWFRGSPDPCPPPAPVMAAPCYDPCNPCGAPAGGAVLPPGAVVSPGPMGPGS